MRKLSGFWVFSRKERVRVRSEFPALTFEEVSRRIGEAWRQLSDDEKKPFLEKAAEGSSARSVSRRRDFKSRAPQRRKRSSNAYILFCDANRASVRRELKDKSMVHVQAVLAERWRRAESTEREFFIQKASKLRENLEDCYTIEGTNIN